MEVMEAVFTRRSIRKYKDKPVEKEKTERLLRAAMQAPSAANQQPWEFIVLQEKASLEKLSRMSPYSGLTANAPLALVLLANEEKMKFPENWQQDMAAAAENILLEAVDLGLGAVWLGAAPLEDRMNYVRKMCGLKESIKPFCVIALGYPEEQENKLIDRYNPSVVYYEKYRGQA